MGICIMVVRRTLTPFVGVRFSHPQPPQQPSCCGFFSGCSAVGSALGSGPRGRGFESRRDHHFEDTRFDKFALNRQVSGSGIFVSRNGPVHANTQHPVFANCKHLWPISNVASSAGRFFLQAQADGLANFRGWSGSDFEKIKAPP